VLMDGNATVLNLFAAARRKEFKYA